MSCNALHCDQTTGARLVVAIDHADRHLLEISTRVAADNWTAWNWAQIEPLKLRQAAESLREWARKANGGHSFCIGGGAAGSLGRTHLRLRQTDRSGHLACDVDLSTGDGGGPADAWTASLQFVTEPALIERFAADIERLASHLESGHAVLMFTTD